MDNTSSNDVAIDGIKTRLKELENFLVLKGQVLHMRCVCCIVNLVVSEGLRELKTSVLGIRNAVRFVRSSLARLKRFNDCAHKKHIKARILLCLDVLTSWNSTYRMLDATIKYEKAFDRSEQDANYQNYFVDTIIGGEHLDDPPIFMIGRMQIFS